MAVSNNATLAFNRNNDVTFGGVVSGAGAVRQIGPGKTTLTGASTYTGATTVEAGTLFVNGSITSNVTVKDGATFGGSGLVNANITLESGTRLEAVASLDAKNLTWNPGATLVFSLGDGTNDFLALTGALTKGVTGTGGFAIDFVDAGWEVGQTYTLIQFASTTMAGDELTYTNGDRFAGYFTMDGDSLAFTLTAVPEPSTYAIGIAALLGGMILAHRRRALARN